MFGSAGPTIFRFMADFGVMRQRSAEIAGPRGIRPKREEGRWPAYPEPKSMLMRSFVLFLRSRPVPAPPAEMTAHKPAIEMLTALASPESAPGRRAPANWLPRGIWRLWWKQAPTPEFRPSA